MKLTPCKDTIPLPIIRRNEEHMPAGIETLIGGRTAGILPAPRRNKEQTRPRHNHLPALTSRRECPRVYPDAIGVAFLDAHLNPVLIERIKERKTAKSLSS